jgi:ribonuclease P protein component
MANQSFPKTLRLLSRVDFRRVYQRRCAVADGLVRLVGRLNELPHPRLGLSVSRDCGNAVRRNRWKRLLREAFRLSREKLPAGVDLVVIPLADDLPNLQTLENSIVTQSWRLQKRLKRDESAARRQQNNAARAKLRRRKADDE